MATTFTIVVVFIPVAFMPGIAGRFFYQFGITVSAAVLVSLFVAFTLTPMLSSRWLREEDEELTNEGSLLRRGLYWFNHFFEILSEKYKKAIEWSLHHRKTMVFGAMATFFVSLFLIRFLATAFMPSFDMSQLTVTVDAAPGSSLEQTGLICSKIEETLHRRPDVTMVLTTIGSGTDPVTKGTVFAKLVSKREREKGVEAILGELRSELQSIPGANIGFTIQQGMGGAQKPLIMSVRGDDLNVLKKLADRVERIVRATPGAVDVQNSLETSKPEVRIRIDRERASDLGANAALIATTARAMVDGYVASTFQEGDEQFDVRVRLNKEDRTSLENVGNLLIKSGKDMGNGQRLMVPIRDVAEIQQGSGPSKINRFDRQREIRIESNTYVKTLGQVMGGVLQQTRRMEVPPGYAIGVVGQGQMQSETFANMLMALILAIIFVYIVLAAQFESFIHPFSIMLALPMSLIGAVLALLAWGSSLSMMSMIGIIMLMGLVTKNGILLVDYANQLRRQGVARTQALIQAGAIRLRPILMTTFAMIFGMIPVAFALGEGSEFRAPMGQAVIGGLITSTLLTLFIVPVVYSILDDLGTRKQRGKR
ncbi:MAG: Efflux pump membrane transporter BepG [bacterium ADurb.Bin478]|nr:MAG: Efflux pump membrane transporter BepG [bacterium ADurb.Bin478]